MLINFTAQRHLIERLVHRGVLGRGSSIGMIASVAGLGWMNALKLVGDFLDCEGWDTAAAWVAEHEGTDTYTFSKQAINAYVAREALPLLKRGIRINSILPGPTDTPLARANADVWLAFAAEYRSAAGVETLVAQQMANVLIFLCSDAASGVTGSTLLVDQGHVSASLTGAWQPDATTMQFMMGVG